MKYKDGQTVLAGDVVQIDGKYRGMVIAAIDDQSYLPGEESWAYLGHGTMIDTDFGGLVHYTNDTIGDEELVKVGVWKQKPSWFWRYR